MLCIVPANGNSMIHCLSINHQWFRFLQESIPSLTICAAEDTGDAKHRPDKFTCPIRDIGKIVTQLWLQLIGKILKQSICLRREPDFFRVFGRRIGFLVQQIVDQRCIGSDHFLWNGLGAVFAIADKRSRHAV
ncbi:hypothetical protein SDC9_206591 [bioreactor metagenome]|uniref:Uncharacterized protein n=1 Tax=bioreactor metagenome TaxID=1076179 RepID=A0A645J583_9ZZZZ